MKHLTSQQLAEELEMDSVEELFEIMCKYVAAKFFITAKGDFNTLLPASKQQILKYCIDSDDMDSYNFFHSLI